MDSSDEEIETCDIIKVNQDIINYANQLKIKFTNEKEKLFQEIIQEIISDLQKEENT
jgi:hypothetical protein